MRMKMMDKIPAQEEKPIAVNMNSLLSSPKLTVLQEDEMELYEPWKNRNLTHPLGTMGALFHMIKGSLGSGILAIPVAFKNGGLWTSLVGTIIVGIIYTHCVHILVNSCHVLCIRLKKPRLGFAEIAEAAFSTGPTKCQRYTGLAKETVEAGLFLAYYSVCTVYVLFTGASIKQVIEQQVGFDVDIRLYILLVTIIILPIGLIRNLKYLVPFSFLAICSLTFGCGFVLYDVFQDLPPISSRPAFTSFEQQPLFFSTILFAIEGLGTVLPIENAMKHPQRFLGRHGVLNVSMIWLTILYCAMGFFGYLRYGEATEATITLNLASSFMGQTVKLFVTMNVLCSYGLFLYVPCEGVWRKLKPQVAESKQNFYYYSMRIVLILGTVVLAAIIPDLEPFVGLVGAICSSTIFLFFPAIIEVITFWEDPYYMGNYNWKLYKNALLLVLWLVMLTTGVNGSISKILELYR